MISRGQALAIRERGYLQREALRPVEIQFSGAGAPVLPVLGSRSNVTRGDLALVPGGLVGEVNVTLRVLSERLEGFVPRDGMRLQWRDQGASNWTAARIDRVSEPDASPAIALRCTNANKG